MKRFAVFVAVVVLAASLLAIAYTRRVIAPYPTGTDAYERGVIGHRGLAELWTELGVHVLVDRRGVHRFADAPVFFVEPHEFGLDGIGQTAAFADVLDKRVHAGLDSVVVLPKWSNQISPASPRVDRIAETQALAILDVALRGRDIALRREDVDVPETGRLRQWTVPGEHGPRRVVLQERQTLRVSDADVDVVLGTARSALIVRVGSPIYGTSGSVWVVSDPDLLHNFNLHRGDHAQIAVDLLASLHTDTVVLDEVMHGHGFLHTVAGAMASPSTRVFVVQALVVLGLLLWARTHPFGESRANTRSDPTAELVEIGARALASSPSNSGSQLVLSYLAYVFTDAADRLGIPPADVLAVRVRALDELAERRSLPGGATDLLDRARRPGNSATHRLALARQAHSLRARLLGLQGIP